MKVYATLIICMLATLALAQSPVAKAPAASLKVGAKVSVPKAKATVTLPKVKVSAGIAAKTAASASVKATVPKVSAKVTIPSITVPKVAVTASTKAKATVKADPVPLTGTCPQASWMGLTEVAVKTVTGLTICKDLKSSCCTAESMTAYKAKFDVFNKRLSAIMWSVGKIPLMNVHALSQLSDKMRTPATAPVPPVTPAKKDEEKKRRLQLAVKAKVAAPKLAVKAKVAAPKLAVKAKVAVPKIAIKAAAKPTASIKISTPKVAVKKTTKITLKLAVAAKPTPSNWNMSADGKTPLSNQTQWAAAWNAANTFANKRGSLQSYALKCFTAGLTLRTQVVCAACDNNNSAAFAKGVALNTTSAESYFTNCASFVYMLKEMTATVTKSLVYAIATAPTADMTVALTAIQGTTWDLTDCVGANPESAAVNVKLEAKKTAEVTAKLAMPKVAVAAKGAMPKVAVAAKVAVPKVAVKASVGTKRILQAAVSAKVTVPKVNAKVTVPKVNAKVTVPKVNAKITVPKVTVKAGAKDAPAAGTNGIVVNSWDAYKTSANTTPITVKVDYSVKCQANKTMTSMLVGALTGADIKMQQALMKTIFTAVSVLYTNCTNKDAMSSWTAFKGTKNVLSFEAAKVVAKVAVKAPVSGKVAAKVTVPKIAAKVTVPKIAAKVSVGTKRRLQAPVVTNDLTISETGVKVENYKNTGLDLPKELAGDGQVAPAAARIFGFATLMVLAVSMFFN